MKTHHRFLIGLTLIVASGMAAAALTPGTGGGYYGSAWYTNGHGSIVGPYSSWWACDQALQDDIDYDVNVRGWTIASVNPCSYTPPYTVANPNQELSFAVGGDDAGTGLQEAVRILEQVRRLRETYMIDEYEAELRRIK